MLKARIKSKRLEAGCDEVGRGCLAGPVVAAAVILPPRFRHPFLKDSKQLTERRRIEMGELIKQKALAWSIAEVSPLKIDEINILNSSFLAMSIAIRNLEIEPELLLIDGNRFYSELEIPFECIIKGDSKVGSIAAASILAKNYRDNLMKNLHHEFPFYAWDKNMGYPTKAHRRGIVEFGTTYLHRQSFQLLPKQDDLKL